MTSRAWPLLLAVTLTVALAPPAGAQSEQDLPAFRGITTVPPRDGSNGGGVYCGSCGRTVGRGAPVGSQPWLHDQRRQGGDSIDGPVGVAGDPIGAGGFVGGGGGNGGGGEGCTPVAPQPPVPSWAAAPVPASGDIATDPSARGWTGLTTYFTWSGTDSISWVQTGTPGVAADCAAIPAPTVTFTAAIVAWHWDVGEASMTTTAPQTEHFYERKDVYELTVACEWAGDPAGTIQVPCGQRPYEVWEIRSAPVER